MGMDVCTKFDDKREYSVSQIEVETLLLHGKREEAVSSALASKSYALALLIASTCDHYIYQSTAQRFINDELFFGSSLQTALTLFVSQDELSDELRESSIYQFWADRSSNLSQTWRQ